MLRLSHLGLAALGSSILLVLFQSIAGLVHFNQTWTPLCVGELFGDRLYQWIDGSVLLASSGLVNTILNLPVFVALFIMAILLFCFSGMFEK